MKELIVIDSISSAHEIMSLPKPTHPLISVVSYGDMQNSQIDNDTRIRIDLFSDLGKKWG